MNQTLRRLAPFVLITAVAAAAWTLAARAPHGATPIAVAGDAVAVSVARTVEASPAPAGRIATPRGPGAYNAPVGTHLRYAVEGRVEFAVGAPDSRRQTSGLGLRGELDLTVADRRQDVALVRAEFAGMTARPLAGATAAGDLAALGRALRTPFFARIGVDGRVLGYRFDAALDGEQRNFVRALFAAFMHTVPPDARSSWEALDVDTTGEVMTRLRVLAAEDDLLRIERVKLHYTSMAKGEVYPHVLSGRSLATLSSALGWLRDVDVDDCCELDLADLRMVVAVRTVLRAELSAHGTAAELSDTAALWDAAWAHATSKDEVLGASAAEQEREQWRRQLAGRSLASLVAELTELLRTEPCDKEAVYRAWVALSWLVRLDANASGEIRLQLPGLHPAVADVLLTALGAAGTPSAQAVLAAVRHDHGLPAAVRTCATLALTQVAEPSAAVLAGLFQDVAGGAQLVDDNATAMLVLGVLAPRGDASVDGRSGMQLLVEAEGAARRQGRVDLWLTALGNAGTDAVLPLAQRYAGDGDDSVRGAAYNALRKVEGAAALDLLLAGTRDGAPSVRSSVVDALTGHAGPRATAALIDLARQDADEGVRRDAVAALARRADPGSPARAALEAVASADPSAAIRAMAHEVLHKR